MAYFNLNGKKAYYEVHGESDRTLVILNGIMMSTSSWLPFIPMLKRTAQVVLVDFFDQGKSEYMTENYTQAIQVELVEALLDALDLQQVTLLGISYGGEVAMKCRSSRVSQLILANTTAHTDQTLTAIGDSWVYAAETFDGSVFFKATIPPIYSKGFYNDRIEWLNDREKQFKKAFKPEWYQGFIRLVRSAESHDERKKLSEIQMPVLIISAEEDVITPPQCQNDLNASISDSKLVIIKHCGHAAMYEKPTEFFSLVVGFMLCGQDQFTL
ncbi:alpha/beta fold hydrolase [Fusibacter ferrireducens]|uniref:Alpha/beta hydrolase n=1 Tax=Fusibacter ferrireducens TaxID=2785058 RepID=A0ABR9ZT38_9FIRM|nr:alpha/beta hydrolase [Fusibacter ferrireducens]MBF4693045.1 alpha/beta hydrolase [Fusibacter ferrireducens]